MSVRTRNKTAAYLAIVGGILIVIAGGTGMVGFLNDLKNYLIDFFGSSNQIVDIIFWILILIASLGGIAVMLGGYLFYKEHIRTGKVLINLGAGFGVISLIIGLVGALSQGNEIQFFSWLTSSFMGIGILLAIISGFVAKSPDADSKKSKRR